MSVSSALRTRRLDDARVLTTLPRADGGRTASRPFVKGAIAQTTEFVNLLLSGAAPAAAKKYLAGVTLISLRKKEGDVRPIAVGEVWGEADSQVLCGGEVQGEGDADGGQATRSGWRCKWGVGAAVQVARGYAFRYRGKNKVTLKIDLANAFNPVR